jgi:hypothetical protein
MQEEWEDLNVFKIVLFLIELGRLLWVYFMGISTTRPGSGKPKKRKELLATAKKFANTAAAMLDERKEVANFAVHFRKKDREIDRSLEKARQLRKH